MFAELGVYINEVFLPAEVILGAFPRFAELVGVRIHALRLDLKTPPLK